MHTLALIPQYILWHYTKAFRDIFSIWKNLLWFIFHFFSTKELIATLFAPWKRLGEERKRRGFDIGDALEVFVVNTIMRLVGFVARIILIIFSLAVWVVVFAGGIVMFAVWICTPIILALMFISGVNLIIS